MATLSYRDTYETSIEKLIVIVMLALNLGLIFSTLTYLTCTKRSTILLEDTVVSCPIPLLYYIAVYIIVLRLRLGCSLTISTVFCRLILTSDGVGRS